MNTIVTSRIIGYEEARLEQKKFSELVIQNFNDQQVEEYVRKWYDKEEEIIEVRDREIKGFLQKKDEIDGELIKNPLLLSLIVIIYRNILKLPESKLEIYQSCTKTLVDKWDASKELVINLDNSVLKNKDKLFGDLAYWQYELLSGKSTTITYERAKKTVSKSIQEKLKIVDDFVVNDLADSFMEYAQKRSIYFDNNFTHKTFLEYYTAYWIYSNIEKKHEIVERDRIFEKYINNPFWFIVLELLLNLIDKDQGDTEIIDGIITKQAERTNESLPFLLATLPSLKNISEERIKYCIDKAINFLYRMYLVKSKIENSEKLETKIFEALQKLFSAHSLFRLIIISVLKEKEIITEDLEKTYSLYLELNVFPNDFNRTFELGNEHLYEEHLRKDPYLFILDTYTLKYRLRAKNYFQDTISFLKNFGSKSLFTTYSARYANYIIGEFFSSYYLKQLEPRNISSLSKNLKNLISLGLDIVFVKNLKEFARISDNGDKLIDSIIGQYLIEENADIQQVLISLIVSIVNSAGSNKFIIEAIKNLPNDRKGNDVKKIIVKTKPAIMALLPVS